MNLESKKLSFIQEFLRLQNEEVISRLENILRKDKKNSDDRMFEPMTQNELNNRIDKSESDFENKRYKSSSELLAKYEE